MITTDGFNEPANNFAAFSDAIGRKIEREVTKPDPVPGPLPIFGVLSAFGFSRNLRRRIRLGGMA